MLFNILGKPRVNNLVRIKDGKTGLGKFNDF